MKRFKDIHKGGEIAILCNGQSLYQDIEDLKIDKIPTIGVNASWRAYESTYHLALDDPQVRLITRERPDMKNLIIGHHKYPERPENVSTIHMLFNRKVAFNCDITKGIYICRSITWSAIQLANYMLGGKGEVYLLGFDLGGKRIKGHPKGDEDIPNDSVMAQYELMGYLRSLIDSEKLGIKVFISSKSKSKVRSIPRINYLTRHKIKGQLYREENDLTVTHLFPISPKTAEWIRSHQRDNLPKTTP